MIRTKICDRPQSDLHGQSLQPQNRSIDAKVSATQASTIMGEAWE